MPKYRGGSDALRRFLARSLKWPNKELDIQGVVLVSFVVLENGQISQVIVEKSLTEEFDNEAKRVIMAMPKWIPGEIDGKNVDVKLYFPIDFTIHYK